jgi:hypothetical protein
VIGYIYFVGKVPSKWNEHKGADGIEVFDPDFFEEDDSTTPQTPQGRCLHGNVLFVCKQLYEEAHQVFWTHNSIILNACDQLAFKENLHYQLARIERAVSSFFIDFHSKYIVSINIEWDI